MTRTYQADDTNERFADSDMEAYGDADRYAVLEGCAITYDVADLTFDVAAGFVLHNGNIVQVAAQANADTIVVDGSNPRWAVIRVDSGGTVDCFEGTAAATPEKPEVGDFVELAWIKPINGDTIADSIVTKLDKRIFVRQAFAKGSDIASASSLAVSGSLYRDVTGSTTITAIADAPTGWIQIFNFVSTPQLTHNGTSFILHSGINETMAAGDVKAFVHEGSGNWREIFNLSPSSGAAPASVNYLVGTADPTLSSEIVVGTTPGGELGNTWASPTVDATHSGSAHHAQAHDLESTGDHAQSGLTAGHVVRASAASVFGFAQLQHTDLGTVSADQHHAQSHTVASHSDTTGTGAELETLTDDSDASALHRHAEHATLFVSAANLTSPSSNGAADATTHGTNFSYPTKNYDTTTEEHADIAFPMPSGYAGSNITFTPYWTAASGSGTVSWEINTLVRVNSDVIDTALVDRGSSTDTLITALDLHIGPTVTWSSSLPTANDVVQLRISRDVAADTLGVDAKLIGVRVEFTELAA
jgi:hypothetical protein